MFGLVLIHCLKVIVDVFVLGDPRERFLKCWIPGLSEIVEHLTPKKKNKQTR